MSDPLAIAESFGWAKAVRLAAEQSLAACNIERSLLLQGPGTDTEFSGGASGWEVAAQCLGSAFLAHGYQTRIHPLSACEP